MSRRTIITLLVLGVAACIILLLEGLVRAGLRWADYVGGVVAALVPLSVWYFHDRTESRRERWARSGCCAQCGYSLTGNVSGACPECGTPVPR